MSLLHRSLALLWAALLLSNALPLAAQSEKDDTNNVVATYQVRDGALAGRVPADHRQIWTAVVALIPSPLLSQVNTLEFFQIPSALQNEEISTDAYASLNEDGATFTLGLNLDSALSAFVDRDPETLPLFRQTVLHEFGHVLSFQPSQRDDTGTVTGTLVVDEGTLKLQSYLNQFYERFWKRTYPRHGVETASDSEGAALYRKSPASFVSEYAATGPLEDFAESFAFFITEPHPRGQTVKDEKLKFFAGYPELAALREQIRKGL